MRNVIGSILDPHTAWLLLRSMETMKLRMTSAMKNARYVAEFLQEHPKVAKVNYLGFLPEGSSQRDIYTRQCKAPGSTFSFEIHGGEAEAFRMLNQLKLIKLAVSLGGTESLMQHPATMTHSDVRARAPADDRRDAGDDPPLGRHRASRGRHRGPAAGARGRVGLRAVEPPAQ